MFRITLGMPKSLGVVLVSLLLVPLHAAAQSGALPAGVSITAETRIAPFSYGGVGEDILGLAANGSDFAAFTLRRKSQTDQRAGTIIYTRIDPAGQPDLTSRKPVDADYVTASTSNGRALVFWSRSGQIYASRIADDGEFITQVPVMAGVLTASACGDSGCVVVAGSTATVTDAEGQPVSAPISLSGVLQKSFYIGSLAVDDDHGFAFVKTPQGYPSPLTLVRFDSSGRTTFEIPAGGGAASVVWSGGAYHLFTFSGDVSSRTLLETDVTSGGDVAPPRVIATETNGGSTFISIAAPHNDGTVLVVGNPPSALDEVFVLDSKGNVLSKGHMVEPANIKAFGPIASNGAVALLMYFRVITPSTVGAAVVAQIAPVVTTGKLVSYGALDQKVLGAVGVPTGSVVMWSEQDLAADDVHLRAARISSTGNLLDSTPIAIGERTSAPLANLIGYTYPFLRSASNGDDALFLWQEQFQYTVPGTPHMAIRGAVVHFGTGTVDQVSPSNLVDFGGDLAHFGAVPTANGFLIVGQTADGVAAVPLSTSGALMGGPQLIAPGEQFESAASDGQNALVVTSAHIIAVSASGEVRAVLPPPASTRQGPSGQFLAFGSADFLLASYFSNTLTRVTREGFVGSSSNVPVSSSATEIVPVRGGWLMFTFSGLLGTATRIADTDPPIAAYSFTVPVPAPFVAAAEAPDRVRLYYGRSTDASPAAAIALYTSSISLANAPRRRTVAPKAARSVPVVMSR